MTKQNFANKKSNKELIDAIDKLLNSNAFLAKEENTVFSNLGVRAAYYFISWMVLGYGIQVGNGFFVAMVLFISSLLMDYLKTNSAQSQHQKLIKTERFICTIFFLWSCLGLVGIFEIVEVKNVLTVAISSKFIAFNSIQYSLERVWYFLALPTGLTIIDWLITQPAFEESIRSISQKQSARKGD